MLVLTTPAAAVAISSADAKAQLRVTGSDKDTLIARLVEVATQFVEKHLGRSLINTTWTEYLEAFPTPFNEPLALTMAPLSSVTTVKYYDADDAQQTWSSDEYEVLTPEHTQGSIILDPAYDWPTSIQVDRQWPIEVEYVAGYGAAAAAIPPDIVHAVHLVLDDLFRHRGASVSLSVSEPTGAALSRLLIANHSGAYL